MYVALLCLAPGTAAPERQGNDGPWSRSGWFITGDNILEGDDVDSWKTCDGAAGKAGSSWEQLCMCIVVVLSDEDGRMEQSAQRLLPQSRHAE